MQASVIEILFKGRNFERLIGGALVTLKIALLALMLSILLGFILGIVMTLKHPFVRAICRLWLETIRIVPQLVLLFLCYFGLAKALNVHISSEAATVIVFTFWGTGEVGDLVRGALTSLPRHQTESALAIGLTKNQTFLYVLIPQTVRRLIPQTINLATRMINTTSLAMLIGVVEVQKVGRQIIDASRYEAPSAALWIYSVLLLFYFFLCLPISMLANRLEKHGS